SSPPSCARCRAARSISTRSKRFSRSTRCRRRSRSSTTSASCLPDSCSCGTAKSGSRGTRVPRRRSKRETRRKPNSQRSWADAFDEPFADSSALPTYLVAQLAAEDVKVALSGEGGDELFGGYYTYAADLLAQRFGGLATRLKPVVERLPTSARKASFDYRAK